MDNFNEDFVDEEEINDEDLDTLDEEEVEEVNENEETEETEEANTEEETEEEAAEEPEVDFDKEIARLKKELDDAKREKEFYHDGLKGAGFENDDDIKNLVATHRNTTPEDLDREEYVKRKFANDYNLVVAKYDWAKNLGDQKNIGDFGELFYETMRFNDNMNPIEAFELTHKKEIAEHSLDKAEEIEKIRRSEQRKANNKSHLKRVSSGSGGTTYTVPAEVKKWYKLYNPDATDKEITIAYNKSLKGK